MKYIIFFIGIVLLFCAVGCIHLECTGTYELDKTTLVLRDDYTYLYVSKDSDTAQRGTFGIYNNKIELTNILGMTTILTITEDGLMDDEGKVWRKQ